MSSKNKYHKPAILQVLPSMHSGGVERGTVEISSYMVQKGYNVFVASCGGPMVEELYANGVKHITLDLASKNPYRIWKNIQKIEEIIKLHDIDIIHARSRAPAWSAYFATLACKKHFVTTFHGIYNFKNSLKKKYNEIMTKGEVVIANSEFTKKHIIENYDIDESRVKVIHRGVDIASFDTENVNYNRIHKLINKFAIPDDKTIILMPGRITRWKGQQFLLDALVNLPKESYYCIIIGDDTKHPAYLQELKDFVKKHNLQDNVRFERPINDMAALYFISDIVTCPSLEPESFGRIPIETGSMKRIVVATNIGGFLETIKDNETGFLVEPGNVSQMTSTLQNVIALNSNDYETIGNKAAEYIKSNFTIENMCSKTLEIYEELLNGKATD